MKESIFKASNEEGDEIEQIYQGKMAHYSAGCCSKLLFSWTKPMIKVTNKTQKIQLQ
jgi:hypothetical protein